MVVSLLLLLLPAAFAKNVFVSSPFDNFRIECPKKSAAIELSIRMVESVGAKRQDIVFDLSCEHVEELFPWVNIPVGISEMEREDCYYSPMFDPILDSQTEFSCKRREYMAGITRLTDTRIQLMCCRLRSRDEFNCEETIFNKPIGLTRSTVIEKDNQLINSIRVDERGYVVRFCDLAPRNIPDIYSDVKTTTIRPHLQTTPKPNVKVNKVSKTTHNPSTIVVTRPTTAHSTPTRPPTTVTTTEEVTTRTTTTPAPVTTTEEIPVELAESNEVLFPTMPSFEPEVPVKFVHAHPTEPTSEELATVTVAMPEETPVSNEVLAEESSEDTEATTTTTQATTVRTTPTTTTTEATTTTTKQTTTTEQTTTTSATTNTPRVTTTTAEEHHIEDIIKQIQSASSEKADQLFKETVTSLLAKDKHNTQKSSEVVASETVDTMGKMVKPMAAETMSSSSKFTPSMHAEVKEIVEEKEEQHHVNEQSMEDITMGDLSRVTFHNEDFPKPNERKLAIPGKLKVSKSDLPLRSGVTSDFVFLHPINAPGHRRSPIRTNRPHITLWSDEDDEEMAEVYGSMDFTEEPTTRKFMKIRKKVTRAHRLPVTDKPETTTTKETTSTEEMTTSAEDITTNAVDLPVREQLYVREEPIRAEVTTTESSRRDLSAQRKPADTVTAMEKTDNARFIDEETHSSPFENRSGSVLSKFEFQEDEDIEEVINRLSAHNAEVRRAPVRNTEPDETKAEKPVRRIMRKMIRRKDGNKTHRPENQTVVSIPEMTVFESKYKESRTEDLEKKKIKKHSVMEKLVPMQSVMFVGDEQKEESTTVMPTTSQAVTTTNEEEDALVTKNHLFSAETTTTTYDPNSFYHTPKPKPAKKEKILTFCTKDIAIRDERNMVIACGGELDVWEPSRCPQGTDCFLSRDSTYRICCPVSRG